MYISVSVEHAIMRILLTFNSISIPCDVFAFVFDGVCVQMYVLFMIQQYNVSINFEYICTFTIYIYFLL